MLIVYFDNDSASRSFLSDALTEAGFQMTPHAAEISVNVADASLLLIGSDISNMADLINQARCLYLSSPIIAIFDKDDVDARVMAYNLGADDCLSRPFHLRELIAKLHAHRRRSFAGSVAPLLATAATAIDLIALELKIGDRTLAVTKREADLLVSLSRAAGRVVRREDVLRNIWGVAPGVAANLVDVYVGYARRKLSQIDADVRIKSVRGEGFCLVARDI